jgi:hypothetical protein
MYTLFVSPITVTSVLAVAKLIAHWATNGNAVAAVSFE